MTPLFSPPDIRDALGISYIPRCVSGFLGLLPRLPAYFLCIMYHFCIHYFLFYTIFPRLATVFLLKQKSDLYSLYAQTVPDFLRANKCAIRRKTAARRFLRERQPVVSLTAGS